MRSLLNDFRRFCLLFSILFGFLANSASGSKLNYVLKFYNDDNLADLSFTVLTDEDAKDPPPHSPFLSSVDRDNMLSLTLAPNQLPLSLHRYPEHVSPWHICLLSADGRIIASKGRFENTLADIDNARRTEPSGDTGQRWQNVLIPALPFIHFTGVHAQSLVGEGEEIAFSPMNADYVTYTASPDGNGYYTANIPARVTDASDSHTDFSIPAHIHLNNAGAIVRVSFEYNSVRLELSLQESDTPPTQPSSAANSQEEERETQEVEITFGEEDDGTSEENQDGGNDPIQLPESGGILGSTLLSPERLGPLPASGPF